MARFDRVIPPGEEGYVIFDIDTKDLSGNLTKGMTVWSNDPNFPKLRLLMDIDVIPVVDLHPKGEVYFRTKKGITLSKRFSLTAATGKDFSITGVRVQNGIFKVDTTPKRLTGDKPGYEIIVHSDGNLPYGEVEERVQILTDIPDAQPVEILLYGKVEGTISFFPDQIAFYPNPGYMHGQFSGNVHVNHTEGGRFKIESVETGHKDIGYGIIPIEKGKSFILVFIWTGDIPTRQLNNEIRMSTNSESMPKVIIPYTVMPPRQGGG